MFTGIIEEVGTVKNIIKLGDSNTIQVACSKILSDIHIGDSIAVNGICLTATRFDSNSFEADVMNETIKRSSFTSLKAGSKLNLERAMSAYGRFGGHIVSGHIDGTGRISSVENDGNAVWIKINCDRKLLNGIVEKGSIAIDGISLTVAGVDDLSFSVSIIPHTLDNTILADKKSGDIVNLETDIIGKYVEKLMHIDNGKSAGNSRGLTREFLLQNGF